MTDLMREASRTVRLCLAFAGLLCRIAWREARTELVIARNRLLAAGARSVTWILRLVKQAAKPRPDGHAFEESRRLDSLPACHQPHNFRQPPRPPRPHGMVRRPKG